MWVLLLSGAACLCARDGASRTLLLVSVEVSEARPSMSTIDVDTVHSDERTISFSGYICVHYICAFHGIFYSPETPSDLHVPVLVLVDLDLACMGAIGHINWQLHG